MSHSPANLPLPTFTMTEAFHDTFPSLFLSPSCALFTLISFPSFPNKQTPSFFRGFRIFCLGTLIPWVLSSCPLYSQVSISQPGPPWLPIIQSRPNPQSLKVRSRLIFFQVLTIIWSHLGEAFLYLVGSLYLLEYKLHTGKNYLPLYSTAKTNACL